eukprot:1175501-Prorocentrum_minimum.AAC.2
MLGFRDKCEEVFKGLHSRVRVFRVTQLDHADEGGAAPCPLDQYQPGTPAHRPTFPPPLWEHSGHSGATYPWLCGYGVHMDSRRGGGAPPDWSRVRSTCMMPATASFKPSSPANGV